MPFFFLYMTILQFQSVQNAIIDEDPEVPVAMTKCPITPHKTLAVILWSQMAECIIYL
jgi:hypothetical protein